MCSISFSLHKWSLCLRSTMPSLALRKLISSWSEVSISLQESRCMWVEHTLFSVRRPWRSNNIMTRVTNRQINMQYLHSWLKDQDRRRLLRSHLPWQLKWSKKDRMRLLSHSRGRESIRGVPGLPSQLFCSGFPTAFWGLIADYQAQRDASSPPSPFSSPSSSASPFTWCRWKPCQRCCPWQADPDRTCISPIDRVRLIYLSIQIDE